MVLASMELIRDRQPTNLKKLIIIYEMCAMNQRNNCRKYQEYMLWIF